MKKILLILLASAMLMGCQKQKIKKTLVGTWVYQPSGELGQPSSAKDGNLALSGFYLEKGGSSVALLWDYQKEKYVYTNKKGKWSIPKHNKISFDWGEGVGYPRPGTFKIEVIDDNTINIETEQIETYIRIDDIDNTEK